MIKIIMIISLSIFFVTHTAWAKSYKDVKTMLGDSFSCQEHEIGGFCLSGSTGDIVNFTELASKGNRQAYLKKKIQAKIKTHSKEKPVIKTYRGDYWVLGMGKDTELKGYFTYYIATYNRKNMRLISISHLEQNSKKAKNYFEGFLKLFFK